VSAVPTTRPGPERPETRDEGLDPDAIDRPVHEPTPDPTIHPDDEDRGFETVAGHSASVAVWTAASRATGFLRIIAIAAVLGPTYFANTFQSINLLPNATYELLAGGLIAAMFVPSVVAHIDARDRAAAERVGGGFLGVLLVLFGAVAIAITALGPLIARLLVIGVDDPHALALQQRAGWLLIALVVPQLLFYGVVGTGAAAQNAHGRFALAAGAPVIENLGVVITLVVSAIVFGTGRDLADVSTSQVVLLGAGATASVAAHAFVQWWGAHRAGLTLVPRAGWRDPEVRALSAIALPSLGVAALIGLRYLAVLIVAGAIPGGVVAFTMAVNFLNLPVALGAKPVAAALLPRLARLTLERRLGTFRDEWAQGLGLAFFLTAPAAVAYLALSRPLSEAVAFGAMATSDGVKLIAVSLASVSFGVLGEGVFIVNTSAAYALADAGAPLRAMLVRTAVTLPGMAAALALADGPAVLIVLGLSLTAGDLTQAVAFSRHLVTRLPRGHAAIVGPLARSLAAAAVMVVPAGMIAWAAPSNDPGRAVQVGWTLAAILAGLAAFLGLQRLWHAPEPRQLLAGIRRGTATA
jgi:putative peptidoglycan lipid II flippase